MAAQYFERVKCLIPNPSSSTGFDTVFDNASLGRIYVGGTENSVVVPGATSDRTASGFISGIKAYTVSLELFLRNDVLFTDFRNLDYDNNEYNLILQYPNGAWSNDIFSNSNKYMLVTQIYLESQDGLNMSGIGSPVSRTINFLCKQYKEMSV